MNPHHVELLAACAQLKHFDKDKAIFHAGQPADGFYLIERGTVALQGSVLEHPPITADMVKAGEPLGWSWLFPPYLWHYDARAAAPTTAFFFAKADFHRHFDDDLTFAHDLFKRMSEVMVRRLQTARQKLVEQAKEKSRILPASD
jgi:CRP-like cAMP-binding protein